MSELFDAAGLPFDAELCAKWLVLSLDAEKKIPAQPVLPLQALERFKALIKALMIPSRSPETDQCVRFCSCSYAAAL
jgi:hypothetical protein